MAEGTILQNAARRDVIVIGGSAGGLEALCEVLAQLREDLPAAVFAVLHMGASSHLAQILTHKVELPVLRAESGLAIRNGNIYVAVPGSIFSCTTDTFYCAGDLGKTSPGPRSIRCFAPPRARMAAA